ncbi:MAG: hypothetical protein ACYC35_25430 [Pirellulales bacterium]
MRKTKPPTVSDVLRKTIAESGIPLLTLEQETGVVRASIMRFVRGDQSLLLSKVDALAEYFGLELVQKRKAK